MQDAIRVFFHELGHFIAHEINAKYYGGSGVKEIKIEPHFLNRNFYVGGTKVNLLPDGSENKLPTKEKLPTYLASSTYGCIFQAFYKMDKNLNNCFNKNGEKDYNQWKSCLEGHGIWDNNREVTKLENEYFFSLKKSDALREMMNLDPAKYLVGGYDDSYHVNIDLLRNDTANFIESHHEKYMELIALYKEYIDRYCQQ